MSDRESLTPRVIEAVETQLRRRVSPRTLRRAYRAGYLVLRPWWFVMRPRTVGVKAVVRCGDQVLLVRQSYARRDQWDLPGGFVRGDEDAELAVRRELGEELGVDPIAVVAIARQAARVDRKRERITVYVADVAPGSAIRPSEAEIAEVCWVHRDHLPVKTTQIARRMVARSFWDEFR
jgi:ADP-ribose pyrophosphatase YjhB (NUDIX family)